MAFSEEKPGKSENRTFSECASYAGEHFPALLDGIHEPLRDFKKSLYPGVFRWYRDQNKDLMDRVERAYALAPDPEGFLRELAEAFAGRASDVVFESPRKRVRERRLLDFNLGIVAYICPMLTAWEGAAGRPLADELLAAWKRMFPETNLERTTFESINAGFKGKFLRSANEEI